MALPARKSKRNDRAFCDDLYSAVVVLVEDAARGGSAVHTFPKTTSIGTVVNWAKGAREFKHVDADSSLVYSWELGNVILQGDDKTALSSKDLPVDGGVSTLKLRLVRTDLANLGKACKKRDSAAEETAAANLRSDPALQDLIDRIDGVDDLGALQTYEGKDVDLDVGLDILKRAVEGDGNFSEARSKLKIFAQGTLRSRNYDRDINKNVNIMIGSEKVFINAWDWRVLGENEFKELQQAQCEILNDKFSLVQADSWSPGLIARFDLGTNNQLVDDLHLGFDMHVRESVAMHRALEHGSMDAAIEAMLKLRDQVYEEDRDASLVATAETRGTLAAADQMSREVKAALQSYNEQKRLETDKLDTMTGANGEFDKMMYMSKKDHNRAQLPLVMPEKITIENAKTSLKDLLGDRSRVNRPSADGTSWRTLLQDLHNEEIAIRESLNPSPVQNLDAGLGQNLDAGLGQANISEEAELARIIRQSEQLAQQQEDEFARAIRESEQLAQQENKIPLFEQSRINQQRMDEQASRAGVSEKKIPLFEKSRINQQQMDDAAQPHENSQNAGVDDDDGAWARSDEANGNDYDDDDY